jgi:hypothetical protein
VAYRAVVSVELDFRPDEREAASIDGTEPPALFEETLLLVPVRFRVNGRDLLGTRLDSTPGWAVDASGVAAPISPAPTEILARQPALGFLVRLRQAVELARRTGRSRCYLVEDRDLVFALLDGRLEVTGPMRDVVERADPAEFAIALSIFETRVRSWLEQAAPALRAHASWRTWFPTDTPT